MRSEADLINLVAEDGLLIESIPKHLRSKPVKVAAISKNYTSIRFLDEDEIDDDLAALVGKFGEHLSCLGLLPARFRQVAADAFTASGGRRRLKW